MEAMQWIKEVEMVDSVDDKKSSLSFRCISMPNFEVLDARIASALQKKNQSRGTKGPEAGPFPSRKADCFLNLRSPPGHWEPTILSKTTPTCSLSVFDMTIFRNSIRSGMKFYCL